MRSAATESAEDEEEELNIEAATAVAAAVEEKLRRSTLIGRRVEEGWA